MAATEEARERRVTRREPITVTVELNNGKEAVFEAKPLPWRKRLDLGDMLAKMYTAGFTAELQPLRDPESGAFLGVTGGLFEAAMDYPALFEICYTEWEITDDGEIVVKNPPAKDVQRNFNSLDFDQIVEVLSANLVVNGLDRIIHLLDPDRKTPPLTGASASANEETTNAGEKTDSATDSG
jgi:hypothetical protein